MVSNVEKLRSLRLDRLEFRACKIGTDKATLNMLKSLFGGKKLLAPIAKTFNLGHMLVSNLSRFDRLYSLDHRTGSSRVPGALGTSPKDSLGYAISIMQANPAARTFWKDAGIFDSLHREIDKTTISIEFKGRLLIMLVEEVAPSWYRGSAAIWHETPAHKPVWADANTFVDLYIMERSKYSGGNIMISGFWTPGERTPWLLPNEVEYVQHIAEV